MTSDPVDLADLAARMRDAAARLLESLSDDQRAVVAGPFDVDEQTEWTYLPGHRPGIRIRELDPEQRRLASALLATTYSSRGETDAGLVIRTEAIRSGQPFDQHAPSMLSGYADPQYYLRLLGSPTDGDAPWMWRVSGHHLVAEATLVGDVVSTTPQFFGTQPARVLHGPDAGFRGLPQEEDLARRLVRLLGEDQRRVAIVSPDAPADILSRDDPVATAGGLPPGLTHARMDREQRALFEELINQYLGRATAPVANRAWSDLRDSDIGSVAFGWAGGLEPGQGHYYAVTGATLLLEYDNTQEDANHIHSVWRDLRHDWGGDLLAHHYRSGPHQH